MLKKRNSYDNLKGEMDQVCIVSVNIKQKNKGKVSVPHFWNIRFNIVHHFFFPQKYFILAPD